MSPNHGEGRPDDESSLPLNYATAERRQPLPPPEVPFIAQMALGVMAFVVGATLSVLAAAGVNALGAPAWLIVGAAGGVQCILFTGAIILWRRWGWRGFFTGVLTGVLISMGLVLLVAGLCFAAVKGIR